MDEKKPNRIVSKKLTKRIEQEYARNLANVGREVDSIVKDFTKKLDTNKDKVTLEDIENVQNRLHDYSVRLKDWAQQTVTKLVYSLKNEDIKEWEQHSERMSEEMKRELARANIKEAMDAFIRDNVKLITSLPLSAAERIQEIVRNNLTTGTRAETVAKELSQTGIVTKSRAMLIARTETSKMVTNMVKARAEEIGLNWFVWKATGGYSGDGRTRSAHRKMDNVLCTWNDPPNPEALFPDRKAKPYGDYLPGATFNCRCYAAPLIRLDDVSWPARVHVGGKIVRMNKREFMKISEQEFLKAA
jgi:SPP1 gp7 family putative phage head morphogenesis protein